MKDADIANAYRLLLPKDDERQASFNPYRVVRVINADCASLVGVPVGTFLSAPFTWWDGFMVFHDGKLTKIGGPSVGNIVGRQLKPKDLVRISENP